MTQTGTAPQHSVILWAASVRKRGARMPVPLPILRIVSSQPMSACLCGRDVLRRLKHPRPIVNEINGRGLQLDGQSFN